MDLAEILASGQLTAPGKGGVATAGFAFGAWFVFQEYCGRILAEALRRLGSEWQLTRRKRRFADGQEGAPSLRCDPDFVVWRAGEPVVVLDAKYKRALAHGSRPDEANVYQVLTAARAYASPCAVLLQPAPLASAAEASRWNLRGRGDPAVLELWRIRPATIRSMQEHLEEVKRLAGWLRQAAPAKR